MADRILHISADYPDSFSAAKPQVVRSLIELTCGQFDHQVVSINRQSPAVVPFLRQVACTGLRPSVRIEKSDTDDILAIGYRAPPLGLFHTRMLESLADQIVELLAGQPAPALVLGHKLTIEGFVAERIARRLGTGYGVSIQGNTDTRILAARPDLARQLGHIFHGASVVFPFAPWALRRFEQRLGERHGSTFILPCPTVLDQPIAPRAGNAGRFVTAFHLRNHKVKNLAGMVAAMRALRRAGHEFELDIAGGGDRAQEAACQAMIGTGAGVSLLGHHSQVQLQDLLNGATGFVLPSRRESFGLVFLEALFAGTPVIYPAGAAVDGYFDGAPFAIRVDAGDPAAIAAALVALSRNEAEIKAELRRWQLGDEAKRFTRPAIAARFAEGIRKGLSA